MRVVFDTNVLVSALALPGGRGDEALRKIVDGQDSFALSRSILDEFLSVLARKFAHDREARASPSFSPRSALYPQVRLDKFFAVLLRP